MVSINLSVRYYGQWLTFKVAYDVRNQFYESDAAHCHFHFHDNAHTGDLMSRATGDVRETEMFVGQGVSGPDIATVLLIVTGVDCGHIYPGELHPWRLSP